MYCFRLSHGEFPNIAPPRPVYHARKSMQSFHVRNELDAFIRSYAALSKLPPNPLKFRIAAENGSSPTRSGRFIECFHGLSRPICRLGPRIIHRFIDKRIRHGHVLKALRIPNQVGTQRVQQHKQVFATKLDRGCGQKDRSLGVVTEKSNGLVRASVRIADMMRFIHDHEVETRRRVQIQQSLSRPSFAPSLWPVKKFFAQQRVRKNRFLMLSGPFAF